MEKKWVIIYSSTNHIEVEIIKQMLEENLVNSVAINQQDSSYNLFGSINLFVHEQNLDKATKLISEKNERNN